MARSHVPHFYFTVSPQLVSDSFRFLTHMGQLLEQED